MTWNVAEIACKVCEKKIKKSYKDKLKESEYYCENHIVPKLRFARIDASEKDCVYLSNYGPGYYRSTYNNELVMKTATKEYLQKLKKLQDEIRRKYGGLLECFGDKKPIDEKQRLMIEKEVWVEEDYNVYGKLYYR